MGCMNVYLILAESCTDGQDFRETELFKRSRELGLISQKGEPPPGAIQANGDPSRQELLLQVQGMWCTSCAWLIEYAVRKMPGVVEVAASFASDLVTVKYRPQRIPPDQVIKRIESLGYQAQEFRAGMESEDAENRALLLRVGIAAFLWMNVMYLSMTLYISFFERISDSIRQYIPFFIWALATPVIFYCGYPILYLAWRALVNRVIRMESLLSLGILIAYFFSIVQTFRGDRHIYFDTACVIVTLVLAGKLIERNAKGRASRWVTHLHRMMPNKARLFEGGQEHFVTIEALQPGQVVVVKAGERIPVDGVVVDGESHADESLLTGESKPTVKQPGDATAAGSLNLDGVLQIRALRNSSESTLATIVAMVERAFSTRSPLERIVDRASRVFVPCVVAVAFLTFGSLWFRGDANLGGSLMRAISVLVIACPCALGMATPLAITAAMGSASRQGILFRDGGVFERLRKVDAIVLDKTGTITEGNFSVLEFEPSWADVYSREESAAVLAAPGSGAFDRGSNFRTNSARTREELRNESLCLAASLEQYSEHPLGKAIVALANAEAVRLKPASSIEVMKGLGIAGSVDGKLVVIGNRKLLEDQGIHLESDSAERAQEWESQGRTVAFLAWNHELRGMAAFGDRIRADAKPLITDLKRKGIVVHIISGDSLATTQSVAHQVGADHYQAEVLPEQKAEFVRGLQTGGAVVAMVGDGINDAPALAQSDLGVAMGSGTDIAMQAAAVVLMRSSLRQLPEIFGLAAITIRVIKQNLFWAFFYNTLGISLAIAGILNPIMAAGAMFLSSASVIANSLRLANLQQRG
ncbi:MAG: cation-translocating P-type ATPase [Terriglobales bacterium]|jgi:heavy metal translocating P-type ATPase